MSRSHITRVIAATSAVLASGALLAAWKSDVDLGDVISVRGRVIASRRGELSIMATRWSLAAQSLRARKALAHGALEAL